MQIDVITLAYRLESEDHVIVSTFINDTKGFIAAYDSLLECNDNPYTKSSPAVNRHTKSVYFNNGGFIHVQKH